MSVFHFFLALLAIMIWGFNFVTIKLGLDGASPLLFGFARFFLTSIPAVFFVKRPSVPFKMVLSYGLVMFAFQFSLLFMGIDAGVTPGTASLLLQLQVLFAVLLAAVFLGEKLRPWQISGILVSFTGIALVALHANGNMSWLGFSLVIGAAVSWGVGNVITKRMGQIDMFSLVVWGSFIAWPPLLILALITEGKDQVISTFQNLNWLSGGSILYIAYLATLLAFTIWNRLLRLYPLGTIVPFTILAPIFGILSSVLVLDEPLQSWKIWAAILVTLGLCINLFGPKIVLGKNK